MQTATESPTPRPARGVSRGAAIALTLFALPFCAGGLWAAWEAARIADQGPSLDLLLRVVFALVFGGAGAGLIALARFGGRAIRDAEALRAAEPDRPWLWRREWRSGRIRCSSTHGLVFFWVFAALWSLMSSPLLWLVADELDPGDPGPELIGLLFPLIGVCLLAAAIYQTLRFRRYGRSLFAMTSVPGVVGGGLAGTVHVPAQIQPSDGFEARLSCVNRVTTGSGDDRSTDERIRWQRTDHIRAGAVPGSPAGTAIPVSFQIPFSAEASSAESSDDEIVWRLELSADVPGVDYAASFEVPVFRTDTSSPDVDEEAAAAQGVHVDIAAQALGSTPRPIAPGSRITVATRPDGALELHVPPGRNRGFAAGVTVVALVWTAATAALFVAEVPLVMRIVFGAFAGLLLYASLSMWLHRVRVRVHRGALEVRHSILGIGRWRRYEAGEIESVDADIRSQSGSVAYYDVSLRLRGRRLPRNVAGTLRSEPEARAIARIVRERVQTR